MKCSGAGEAEVAACENAIPASCDVAVVGAGPAGAATARRLAQSGLRVVLLERSRFDDIRVGETLAPAVQPLLADLGLWRAFCALGALPSHGTRAAWGSAVPGEHSHMMTPYLNGWHVDRLAFDRMLAEGAAEAGAQLFAGARVTHCASASRGIVLRLAHTKGADRVAELRADFVVDATGRGSALSRWLGARHAVFDRLVSVATGFSDASAASHCYALVETCADGWWYSAPVAGNRRVAMLMTDGDLVRRRRLDALPAWQDALRRTDLTARATSEAKQRWGPRIFSSVSRRLLRNPNAARQWLAVGDAALAVDPISGSGVLRALRTAQAAAVTVTAMLGGKRDEIDRYESDRDDECTTYLVERAAYYGAEQRWRGSLFWDRRAV